MGVKAHAAIILIYESGCDNIDECGSGSLEIIGKGAKTMSTMEVLTLGILLVNVIGLVFNIKKDK